MEKDFSIFFDNHGLSHIGAQFLSYLNVDDLWSCRQVGREWKKLADIELKKLRNHYSQLEDEWWEQDEEYDEYIGELGDEFQEFWFTYLYVFGIFGKQNDRNYVKFIQFMERYIAKNRHDFTILSPLHWAIKEQDIESIKLMMPALYDIESHETQESYPPKEYALHVALKGSLEIFKLICEKAEWLVLDVNEALPLHPDSQDTKRFKGKYVTVMMRACLGVQDDEQYLEKIEFMLEHGDKYNFNFKAPDKKCENSPFNIACNSGNLSLVNLLLRHSDKINLNNKDGQGQSGFVSACRRGHVEVVKRLLEVSDEKGIDLNIRDAELDTGLCAARKKNQPNIVEILIESKKLDLEARGGVRPDELKEQLKHFGMYYSEETTKVKADLEAWLHEESDELEKEWPSWEMVIGNFTSRFDRSVPELSALVQLLKRYTSELSDPTKYRNKRNSQRCRYGLYHYRSPLHFAIEEKDLESVKLLLPSCEGVEEWQKEVEHTIEGTQNRLLHSAVKSSLEIFQLILEKAEWLGIDVNERYRHPIGFFTNVFLEACGSDRLEFVKLILENTEKFGFSRKLLKCDRSFATVCRHGSLEIVDLLLLHSDKISLNETCEGQSGFVEACRWGNVEIVERLLQVSEEKGIDLNIISYFDYDHGETGLTAACSEDGIEEDAEGCIAVVKLLVEASKTKKIDLSKSDRAFTNACRSGSLELVDFLLLHSDKIPLNPLKSEDEENISGFVDACRGGHVEVVKRLIQISEKNGIDLNARNEDGETALTGACQDGHLAVVEILIEASKTKKIDLSLKNTDGLTSLEVAKEAGHDEIVKYLTEQSGTSGFLPKKKKSK